MVREPAATSVLVDAEDEEHRPLPSILIEDGEDEMSSHRRRTTSVSFDAEEDLDIPDFLKS